MFPVTEVSQEIKKKKKKSQGKNVRSVLTTYDPHWVQRSWSHLEINCVTRGQCYWRCTLVIIALSFTLSHTGQSNRKSFIVLLVWRNCSPKQPNMRPFLSFYFIRIFPFDVSCTVLQFSFSFTILLTYL